MGPPAFCTKVLILMKVTARAIDTISAACPNLELRFTFRRLFRNLKMTVRADFILVVVVAAEAVVVMIDVVVVVVFVVVVVSVGATEEGNMEGSPAFSLADLQRVLFLSLEYFRLEFTFARLRRQAEAIKESTFESGDIREIILKLKLLSLS